MSVPKRLKIKPGFLNKPTPPDFQEKVSPFSREKLKEGYHVEVAANVLSHTGIIEDPKLEAVAKKPRLGIQTLGDNLLEQNKYFDGEGNELTKHILPEHKRAIRLHLVNAVNEYLKTNPTDPDELRSLHYLLYSHRPADQQHGEDFKTWETSEGESQGDESEDDESGDESNGKGGRRTRKNRKSRKRLKRNHRKSRR